MTPQLQDIKDRLSKIESDTAEARKMLEKVEKVETPDFSGMVSELEKAKNALAAVAPAMNTALKSMLDKMKELARTHRIRQIVETSPGSKKAKFYARMALNYEALAEALAERKPFEAVA